jgi:hypothetical protein
MPLREEDPLLLVLELVAAQRVVVRHERVGDPDDQPEADRNRKQTPVAPHRAAR